MPKTMSRLSTDDFIIPVQVLIVEGVSSDPTEDAVLFCFVPRSQAAPPSLEDFTAGFWLDTGAQYLACITVGPSGTISDLEPGVYNAWIWIVDNPTQPVQQVDTLTII